jgi:hypothetical protein
MQRRETGHDRSDSSEACLKGGSDTAMESETLTTVLMTGVQTTCLSPVPLSDINSRYTIHSGTPSPVSPSFDMFAKRVLATPTELTEAAAADVERQAKSSIMMEIDTNSSVAVTTVATSATKRKLVDIDFAAIATAVQLEQEKQPRHVAFVDEEQENYDPFADFGRPASAVTASAKRSSNILTRPSALETMFGPIVATSPSLSALASSTPTLATPARKKAKTTSLPSDNTSSSGASPSLFRSPAAVVSSDENSSSNYAAAASSFSGSSSTPPPTVHQALVDDFLNVDRAHQATRDPFAVKRRKIEQSRACCPSCNELLTHTTWEDHKSICKSVPPPLSFISIEAAASSKLRSIVQHLATKGDRWPRSMLVRYTHVQFAASKGAERRRLALALKWLRSMLHNNNGRIDDEKTPAPTKASPGSDEEEEGDEETKTAIDEEEENDLAIQPGQEVSRTGIQCEDALFH